MLRRQSLTAIVLLCAFVTLVCVSLTEAAGNGNGNNGNGNGNNGDPSGLSAGKDKGWNFNGASSKAQILAQYAASSLSSLSSDDFNAAAQDNTPGGSGGRKGGLKLRAMFNDWADTFGMSYNSPSERHADFKNFVATMMDVKEVNSDPETPYWASGNAYSGMSFEQFSAARLMNNMAAPTTSGYEAFNPSSSRKLMQLPASKNWVSENKVTPVRDQGQCGSCWAFAATSVIESMYLIKVDGSPVTINLSEQQMVSCVNSANGYSSAGCNGGYSDQAINYVAAVNQTTEGQYPYASQTGSCNMAIVGGTGAGQALQLSGRAQTVTPKSESAFMSAVVTAPTVIYFTVVRDFQSYAGGVYSPRKCGTAINHAMVAVGYMTGTSRYWVIRNSWGSGWGEAGYIRVKMSGNGAGTCGMYQYGYLPPQSFTKTLA